MDADVIVIGSGGGGSVVAKELGEKGLDILVLEAGPWYGNSNWPKPNSDVGGIGSSSIDDLNQVLLKEQFTDYEDDMNDYVMGKFRWGPANRGRGPWHRNIEGNGFTMQNAGVGGTTLHYYANSPRAYPQSVDNIWPIPYQELVTYYQRVEATLPVSVAPTTAKEELFFYGAKQSGYELIPTLNVTKPGYRPQPQAIYPPDPRAEDPEFDFRLRNPVGCVLRGHCINGCHIGPSVKESAKRSTLVSYVPLALETGHVEIRPNSFVIKVLTKTREDGEVQAIGVRYRNTWTGEIGELRARVVVMAAGAVETPRLWLNSKLPDNPWVGKGLVNHYFDCMAGIFDEESLMNSIGTTDIRPYVGQNAAARLDYPGLGVVETFGMSPGLFSSWLYGISSKGYSFLNKVEGNVPWDVEGLVVGGQLKAYMRQYSKTLGLLIFTDDDVNQNNSVTVDPEVKDENGFIPVINYKSSEANKARRDQLAVIGANILRNAGAKIIIRSNWPQNVFVHIQCTMRMGYVTDTNCEAQQVKGLYIADNSVLFNSLGGPNPTLTTQALATRTSDKIYEKYFA